MAVTVTFAGCGDAFGSGGRFQACIHLREPSLDTPVLLDCGATSLTALRRCGLDPGEIGAVFVSHLHGDHFGGLPFLILDGQFSRRTAPLVVAGPPGTAQRLTAAMECLFPGSSDAQRRFEVSVVELTPGHPPSVVGLAPGHPASVVELAPGHPASVVELAPGHTASVAGIQVSTWTASHPSGAPALILRLAIGGTVIAYTGDTAWTPAITEAAAGADLLIAEAYYWDKPVPHHLRYADLSGHAREITARRVVLTHMSGDMLARQQQVIHETARDGLAITI